MHIGVLGALQVETHAGDGAVNLGGPRQRSVLAMLLTAHGDVVPVDRLVDGVWDGRPPRNAIGVLQSYVSHLRRVLEPHRLPRSPAAVLRSEPPGYAVHLPAEAVDAWHFELLVETASARTDPAGARAELQQALSLWHGDAYAEVADRPWAVAEIAHLTGLRTVATERLCSALLAEGRPEEAVLHAERLLPADPLREESWRLLALSLYHAGRQADALAALRQAKVRLAAEVGLDPHPTLLRLEADILARRVDLGLQLPVPTVVATRSTRPPGRALDAPPHGVRRPAGRDGFVGRTRELATIRTVALNASGGSRGATVLVTGDAGAGKSALLARAAEQLTDDGWLVVTGRCSEDAGTPPGSAWSEVLRGLDASSDRPRTRHVFGSLAAAAPSAVATLAGDSATPAGPDPSVGRYEMVRAVVDHLVSVAHEQPLAVVLEDAHRADSLSASLTAALVRDATAVPLLLFASYRSGEHSAPSDDLLAALAPALPTRVTVAGLHADEAAELVAAASGVDPDADTVRALVERTGGNAYFLAECARLLGSEGTEAAVSGMPDGVREVLRHRLHRLGPARADVLRLAAVIGRDVDTEILIRAAEAVGVPGGGDRVLDAVEIGVIHRLLVDATPGVVRFVHEVAREAVYDDVPAPRRATWHARVADAVSELRPHDVAALAHHLVASGTAAGARAALTATTAAAANAMARYAPESAVALYGQALHALHRLTGTGYGGAEEVELLSQLSLAELAAGSGTAALQTRSAAVRTAERSGDPDLLVRTLSAWDLPTLWTVRPYGTLDAELVALHERALLMPELADAERCRVLCSLVRESAGHELARALAASAEAETLARHSGDPVLLGLALHARGVALLNDSDLTSRLAPAEELVRLGERPGLPLFTLIGHEFVAQWAAANGRTDVLDDRIDRMDVLVRTYGWRQAVGAVGMHRALSAHLHGDVTAAEQRYSTAVDVLRRNGNLDAEQIGGIAAFSVALSTDRLAALEPLVRSFEPLPPPAVDLLTLVLEAGGRPAEAAEVHARARPPGRDFFRSLWLTVRGLALVRLAQYPGTVDGHELEAAYTDLSEFSDQVGGAVTGSFALGPVDMVLGDLACRLDAGRAAGTAAEHYARAVEVANRCGSQNWRRAAQLRAARLT